MDDLNTKLLALSRIFSDEQASFSYLLRLLQKRATLICPQCHYDDFYLLSRRRLKCRKCRKEFRPLVHTRLSTLNISCAQWLSIVKKFELGLSARQAFQEIDLSYKTTLKAFTIIRGTILEMLSYQDPALRLELENETQCNSEKNKRPYLHRPGKCAQIFGISEEEGNVTVDIIKHLSTQALAVAEVKKARRGSIIYTDRWEQYDALLFCIGNSQRADPRYKFRSEHVYIDSRNGFWSYALKKLAKPHVLAEGRFLSYLKELEWRYNHQHQDIFDLLINYLVMPASHGRSSN